MKAFIAFAVCSLIATAIYFLVGGEEAKKKKVNAVKQTIDQVKTIAQKSSDRAAEFSREQAAASGKALKAGAEEVGAKIKEGAKAAKEAVVEKGEEVKEAMAKELEDSKRQYAYNKKLAAVRKKYKVSMIILGANSLAKINGEKRRIGDLLKDGEEIIKMDTKTVTIKKDETEYILEK